MKIERAPSRFVGIVTALMFVAFPATAVADKEYVTTIIPAQNSPAELTKCELWARDANKTYLYSHFSIPNALIDFGVAFKNDSNKSVQAIRLKLDAYDAFGGLLKSGELDSTSNRSADNMLVPPGGSYDLLGPRGWHFRNDAESVDHLSCEITAVRFSDGTIWSPSAAPTPKPPR